MQLEPQQTIYIRKAFENIKDKYDFLHLLNYVKELVYGKKVVPFEIKQLTYHSNPKINNNRYTTFLVKKKSGGYRTINSPSKGLKPFQSCLSIILQAVYNVNAAATGFVKGKSVLDNAKIHTGNIYVYNIDLKDFFSSIDQARIWGRLQHPPFNLTGNRDKLVVAGIIAGLSCHRFKVERKDDEGNWVEVFRNVLPQGSPSSPVLTNIICQKLDFYFSAIARRFGLKYSRYADDITFSSMYNIFHAGSEFIVQLEKVISEQNFHIKEEKTRLQKDDFRQIVTGLVVNKHANLPKRYINQIKQWLFFWESFGYERANEYFFKKYKKIRINKRNKSPQLADVLDGKLNYLKMIKGSDDSVYQKLLKRFETLKIEKSTIVLKHLEVSAELNVKHSPIDTVKFLKYFKYDNEYAFKQLVHRPIDKESFDFVKTLRKSNSQLITLQSKNDNSVNFPKKLIENVQDFFDHLNENGIPFFRNTGEHPLEDRTTGLLIQKFKTQYRFGNEKSESSILSDLIKNIANKRIITNHKSGQRFSFGRDDTSGQFNINQIKFLPDLFKFQSKANFFTWIPNVTIAVSSIVDSILQHSNLNGSRNFKADEKEILVDIKRKSVGDLIKIELSVLDKGSVFNGNLESMLSNMRREYFSTLVSICDFKVQFVSLEGDSYQCQILPYAESYERLNESVEGFKFLFTFYD